MYVYSITQPRYKADGKEKTTVLCESKSIIILLVRSMDLFFFSANVEQASLNHFLIMIVALTIIIISSLSYFCGDLLLLFNKQTIVFPSVSVIPGCTLKIFFVSVSILYLPKIRIYLILHFIFNFSLGSGDSGIGIKHL